MGDGVRGFDLPRQKLELTPLTKCEKGRLYKLQCRNLKFGVYDGDGGFVGIRTKFGSRFLATEFHWEIGAPYGTVSGAEPLPTTIPEGMELKEGGTWSSLLFEWLEEGEEKYGDDRE